MVETGGWLAKAAASAACAKATGAGHLSTHLSVGLSSLRRLRVPRTAPPRELLLSSALLRSQHWPRSTSLRLMTAGWERGGRSVAGGRRRRRRPAVLWRTHLCRHRDPWWPPRAPLRRWQAWRLGRLRGEKADSGESLCGWLLGLALHRQTAGVDWSGGCDKRHRGSWGAHSQGLCQGDLTLHISPIAAARPLAQSSAHL